MGCSRGREQQQQQPGVGHERARERRGLKGSDAGSCFTFDTGGSWQGRAGRGRAGRAGQGRAVQGASPVQQRKASHTARCSLLFSRRPALSESGRRTGRNGVDGGDKDGARNAAGTGRFLRAPLFAGGFVCFSFSVYRRGGGRLGCSAAARRLLRDALPGRRDAWPSLRHAAAPGGNTSEDIRQAGAPGCRRRRSCSPARSRSGRTPR